MNRLAVSMWCYVRAVKSGHMDLPGFIKEARRIGADGVELLDFFYADPSTDRMVAADTLADLSMPCPIFSVANNFAKPSETERQEQVARVRFGVDEAVFYGAQVVRVFAGDLSEGLGYDQARDWIVDGLTEASDYAHDQGIKLALENHGKLAGRASQVTTLVAAVRDRCGHDALGANPDTGNFLLVDEDSAEAVEQLAGIAYMCHFKDFSPGEGPFKSLSGASYQGTVIGEGSVDLAQCVKVARKQGFAGWFSLEYEGAGDPVTEVEQSLQYARRLLA